MKETAGRIRKQLMQKFGKKILLYVSMGIVAALCNVLSVVELQKALDILSSGGMENVLLAVSRPVLLYGLFSLLCCLLNYVDNVPSTQLEQGIYYFYKTQAIDKIRRIDYREYLNLGTGKLVQMVENGTKAAVDSIFHFWIEIFYSLLPGLVFSLVVLGTYDLRVMLIIGAGYVVIFVCTNVLLKFLYKSQERILVDSEWLSSRFVRALMELSVFRLSGRFAKERKDFEEKSKEIISNETKVTMIHEFFFAFFYLLIIVVKVLIILVGLMYHWMSIGKIVAVILLIDSIYGPIAEFNVLFVKYKLDKVAYRRYMDFMNLPDDENLYHGREFSSKITSLTARQVAVEFGGERVLHGVDASFGAQKTYAIVGKSGAGKSTLIKTLLGLIKMNQGSVSVNGEDIKQFRLDSLYREVAYVSQEPPVFDGTVRENLIFDHEIPENVLWQALESVGLSEKVASMEQGLDTRIGERGVMLSGGEKQKLAIARVLLQDSSVIILDEATSSLDYIAEEQVMGAIRRFRGDAIILQIAHRLKNVKDSDEIYVLENGSVAERGSFDELMARGGVFYQLWNKQEGVYALCGKSAELCEGDRHSPGGKSGGGGIHPGGNPGRISFKV